MQYDDNEIIAGLRKSYWSPDEDGSQIWASFKAEFAKKLPDARRADLRTVEQYLGEQISVTRDHAAMIQMKRELDDVHAILWRAGR